MSDPEFKSTIKLIQIGLNFLGVYPSDGQNYYFSIKFAFIFSFIFFVLIFPQTAKLIYVEKSLDNIIEILTNLLVMLFISWCKLLNGWSKCQDFKNLINAMEEDWKLKDDVKRNLMLKSIKFPKFMVRFTFLSVAGSGLTYTIYRLAYIKFYKPDQTLNQAHIKLSYVESEFFFNTQYSPVYEIVWCSQCMATAMAVVPYAVYESFFVVLVYHLSTQLSVLRLDIRNILSGSKNLTFTSALKSIVKRHLYLKKFSDYVEKMYSNIFLLKMVSYSMVICLQGYQLMILTDIKNLASVLFIFVFLGATIFSVFVNCFVADKLRTESLKIFDEVYSISWYELQPMKAKLLVIMMRSSLMPFELTAGKFIILSLEYFMDVLKTAGGYLSLLFTLKSKDSL